MTSKELQIHLERVDKAERRLDEADRELQRGVVTPDTLKEHTDAYHAYIKVVTETKPSDKPGWLRRVLGDADDTE